MVPPFPGAGMDEILSPILIPAFVAGPTVFVFMAVFFRVFRRGVSATKRLYLAWICTALVWMLLTSQQPVRLHPLTYDNTSDLICSLLILGCFIWTSYWIANFSGGFRVLVLLDLADAKSPVTQREWMDRYGEGRGMREFLDDRLRSILVPLGLVSLEGDQVVLTPRKGKAMGLAVRLLSMLLTGHSRDA
jgi:hypothetical protein